MISLPALERHCTCVRAKTSTKTQHAFESCLVQRRSPQVCCRCAPAHIQANIVHLTLDRRKRHNLTAHIARMRRLVLGLKHSKLEKDNSVLYAPKSTPQSCLREAHPPRQARRRANSTTGNGPSSKRNWT